MRLGVNGRFLAARPTGVQRFAHELTTELARRIDLTLLVPRGVQEVDLPAAGVGRGRLDGVAWEQLELPRAAARARVNVLLHPANACPLWGGPHVQVLHDLTPFTTPSHFGSRYRLWARWAHLAPARRAAAVIAMSEVWKKEIERLASLPRGRVHVAYQGVGPMDAPASPDRVSHVREALGLPDRFFLAVGVQDPRKGFGFLVEVIAKLRRTAPNHECVVLVGVGGHYVRVHSVTGHADGVHLVGHVSDADLRALYTGSVALLFPSEEEGFGRPPLEAMACGTRVIAGPYPAALEVLGAGADLVPRDVDAWVRALIDVLVEPESVREERIAYGRAVASRFTWSTAAERVLEVCAAVARGGASRAREAGS